MKRFIYKCRYLFLAFFIIVVITYNYYVQNDIDNNMADAIGRVINKPNSKGAGSPIVFILYYNNDANEVSTFIETLDSRYFKIDSCYVVELSKNHPLKHNRILPKQVPCPCEK